MANQLEYTTVANALIPVLSAAITQDLTQAGYGWAVSLLPAGLIPALAGACAKTAVDTLEALQSQEAKNG
jgi:hypothetical protein